MTYQTSIAQQRNFDFFAFFSAVYLVVSDILLTHTLAPSVTKTFFILAYAREACRNPYKQRTFRSFLCSFFMPFYELDLEQNKNEITIILNNKQDALTTYPLKMKWNDSN